MYTYKEKAFAEYLQFILSNFGRKGDNRESERIIRAVLRIRHNQESSPQVDLRARQTQDRRQYLVEQMLQREETDHGGWN